MAKTKDQKAKVLSDFKEKLNQMKSVVFVNFSGIAVKEIDQLRGQCRDQEIDYCVAKKTLIKKSLAESGYQAVAERDFTGEVAAIFSYQDEIAPAKLIKDFSKNQEKMKILWGIIDGNFFEAEKIIALAQLPSRLELLAKAVGSMAAPLSGLVNVLQGNLRGLVYVLKAMEKKNS